MRQELKTFIRSYIETALWSSSHTVTHCEGCSSQVNPNRQDNEAYCDKCGSTEIGEIDTNLDDSEFSNHTFTLDAMRQIVKDCEKFMDDELFYEAFYESSNDISQIAHDFWLTRNRHGSGFWDGDYPKELGEKLTEFSHSFGEVNVVPSEGKFHYEA